MNSLYLRYTKSLISIHALRWHPLAKHFVGTTAILTNRQIDGGTTNRRTSTKELLECTDSKDDIVVSSLFDEHQKERRQEQSTNNPCTSPLFWWASIWTWLGLSKDDESPEDKLITTIKRSILCMQRQEYDKAEQMLHLALRMAQDIRSKDGVTYVYDVMANLAMEREQFQKAEKLFVDVMKRLLSAGYADDSPKMLHISSKLAHMAHLQGELEKARNGFLWTLEKIEDCIRRTPNDLDVKELWGLTRNWFGQLLMKQGKFKEAKENFQQAYDCLMQVRGIVNEDAITILNNISVACVNMDNFAEARQHILAALEFAKNIHDTTQEGILYANLGLINLREGMLDEALKCCSYAWKTGKKQNNHDAVEQAEYCLQEIKDFERQRR